MLRRHSDPLSISCPNMETHDISISPPSRWSLHGKTALVTGGTKGIGKAIVEEFAHLGASVYTCARSEKDLKEQIEAWKNAGLSVGGSVCDVSSLEDCKQLIRNVSEHFNGKLHILVNNAGTYVGGPTEDISPEDLSFLLSTNFQSSVSLSQLAYPLLKASGEGNIVFNTSIAASTPSHPHLTIYGSTKAAVNQLTRSLACEWAKDGIRVNAVAPGFTDTELLMKNFSQDSLSKVEARTPLGRLGKPEEISAAVAFLCMRCSSFTTGHIFPIDGGLTAHNYIIPCNSRESH